MAYQRKGGAGLGNTSKGSKKKPPTLKQQFNYAKQQVKRRLIEEQAFIEARGGFSFSGKPSTLFKNLDYAKIMSEGITRKVGSKTIRFTGEEAVKTQIESLQRRASKSYQSGQFIDNYVSALRNVEMNTELVNKIETALQRISTDKLSILIDKNILPQIHFLYAEEMDEEELFSEIMDALKSGVTTEEVKTIRQKRKALKPVIKAKFDIMGW